MKQSLRTFLQVMSTLLVVCGRRWMLNARGQRSFAVDLENISNRALWAVLVIFVTILTAASSAQTVGCAANTANYPCVYVANSNDGTVSAINAISNSVVATVTVGTFPEGLAVTPNNASVYVANSGDGTVSVINTATNAVVATVSMQNRPFQIAITPDGAFAYVTEFRDDRAHASKHTKQQATPLVEVIDTTSNLIVSSIANLTDPSATAISPNGDTAYVADVCAPNEDPCVEVVSTSNNQIIDTVQIPGTAAFSEGSIEVTPDGSLVCLSVGVVNGESTDLDIAFINTSNNTLLATLSTQTASAASDYGFAMTPGELLYVAASSPDGVYLVNPALETLVETIQAGTTPTGAALAPDGASVYVTNAGSNNVSIINTKTNAVTGTIIVGNNPQGVAGMQVVPVPLINQPLVPDAIPAGGSEFTLTVNGTGFVSKSVVNWNGTALTTTFVNSGQLTAVVPALNIARASSSAVTVANPAPGGGTSNPVFFPITSATASIALSKLDNAAGTAPDSIATGDFNRDGKLDLAVANNGSNTVSIMLGNGDGTFQSQVTYSTGVEPFSIVTADFNGDGKLDLAVANAVDNTVSILLGNGDGTFQPQMPFAVGTAPVSVAAADFNGDGKLDLAVSNLGDGTVSILLGNGDGTFQPQITYPVGSEPYSVITADFNRDGILDLAVTNRSDGTVSVLLGNGDGTFQPQTTFDAGTSPVGTVTADFNDDGKLDLAVANALDGSTISILLGNGDGTFQSPVPYAVGSDPASISLGDLNGDGKLDLAVGNFSASTISVLLGNGDGTFQGQIVFPSDPQVSGIVTGDFNGDGRLDLATSNQDTPGSVSVFLQSAVASLTPPALAFGNQLLNTTSNPQPATLANTGSAALNISSISVGGVNNTDFAQTNDCGPVLAAGANCTIDITFTPLATGSRSASLAVSDNASGSPQTVSLTGTGITQPPIIKTQPGSQKINYGDTATLTVTATGTPPLTYQWYLGMSPNTSNPIAGATNSSYTTPALTVTTSYWVQVIGVPPAADSNTAIITVSPRISPIITTQPASQTVDYGQTATLEVVASGTPPLAYQWYVGQHGDTSNPIANATSSTYVTPFLTKATSFWVLVTGPGGSAESTTATISINAQSPVCQVPTIQALNSVQSITLTGTCTDPQNSALTGTVDWGDGSPHTPFTGGSINENHTYTGIGRCQVVVKVVNAANLTGSVLAQAYIGLINTVTTNAGGSGNASLPVQAPPGLTSPVKVIFNCISVSGGGLAAPVLIANNTVGISCDPSQPMTLTPDQITNISLTIHSSGGQALNRTPRTGLGWRFATWLLMPGLVMAGSGLRSRLSGRRSIRFLALGLAILLAGLWVACGGGISTQSSLPSFPAETPAGKYEVTATSSAIGGTSPTGFQQTTVIVPFAVQ